ncbi:MAG: S8 family serine peptidase [Chloroflexota bacterium]
MQETDSDGANLVQPPLDAPAQIPGTSRLLVKLHPQQQSDEVQLLRAEVDAAIIRTFSSIGVQVWELPNGDVEEIIAKYQGDPRVIFIEKDPIITLDTERHSLESLSINQALDEEEEVEDDQVEKEDGHPVGSENNEPTGDPTIALDVIRHGQISRLVEQQSAEQNGSQLTDGTNDPRYLEQWALNNSGQTGGTPDADIDAPEAWSIVTETEIIIGIIDSGIQYTHRDLRNNMWINPGEIADNGIDDDGNGYIDDIYGWDFYDNDNDPNDENGHGTHIAGTVAAQGNNGTGVTGVAWRAKLMALRFMNAEGWGYLSDALAAVEYATAMGANITNNSWGGVDFVNAMYAAVAKAGDANVLFVSAAGNEGNDNDVTPSYPSSYDLENVISVASTNAHDDLSSFSNYGAASVDLAAPGSYILSTIPDSYGLYSGTSMASPQVAGAAALLWATYPNESAAEIKERLLVSTDLIPALASKTATGGRMNLHKALLYRVPAPTLEHNSPQFAFDLLPDEEVEQTLIVTNSGNATLTWEIEISYPQSGATGWLNFSTTSGEVAPGMVSSIRIEASAEALEPGTYQATIRLTSNDIQNSLKAFNVTLNVAEINYPLLSIPINLNAHYWPEGITSPNGNYIDVPISLESYAFDLGAAIFSLNMDSECLAFDMSDANEDGYPDAVVFAVPDDFNRSVLYTSTNGRGKLNFMIADLGDPIAVLPDGTLLTVRFGLTCEPTLAEARIVELTFADAPSISFSDTSGHSIQAEKSDGRLRITKGYWQGDCNDDYRVNAADASATLLEIYDDDGDQALDAAKGGFLGSVGCDSNQDEQIDVGDLICTAFLIFNGQNACTGNLEQVNSTRAGAELIEKPEQQTVRSVAHSYSPLTPLARLNEASLGQATPNQATLTIPEGYPTILGESVQIPVSLITNGHSLSAIAFSIDLDTENPCLHFDEAGGINIYLPPKFNSTVQVDLNDTDSEIDLLIADQVLPFEAIPEGLLMTLTFSTPCQVDELANHSLGKVRFSSAPAPSFADLFAQDVSGAALDGSIQIESEEPIATATSAPTEIYTEPTRPPLQTATTRPVNTATPTQTPAILPGATSFPVHTPTTEFTVSPTATATNSPTASSMATPTNTSTTTSTPTTVPANTPTSTPTSTPFPTPTKTTNEGIDQAEAQFPIVTALRPTSGRNNVITTIEVTGNDLAPAHQFMLENVRLPALYDSTEHLSLKVPIGLAAQSYRLVVESKDGWVRDTGYTYVVEDATTINDLRSAPELLWSSPRTLRVGDTIQVGLTLERMGGNQTLSAVPIRFWVSEGVQNQANPLIELGSGVVDQIGIDDRHDSTGLSWENIPEGEFTLWAEIDPTDQIEESNETNNIVSRQLVVLPAAQDVLPPIIEKLTINGAPADRTVQVANQDLTLTAEIVGESGSAYVAFVEMSWNMGTQSWVPVRSGDWEPAAASYTWSLHPAGGLRYLQSWAADDVGNISEQSVNAFINYIPSSDQLLAGETRVYRQLAQEGECLSIQVEPSNGDPDLYVWPPAGAERVEPWYSLNLTGETDQIELAIPIAGVYQIEIEGVSETSYSLQIELTSQCTQGVGVLSNPVRSQLENHPLGGKEPRSEPQMPIDAEPPEQWMIQAPPTASSTGEILYIPLMVEE